MKRLITLITLLLLVCPSYAGKVLTGKILKVEEDLLVVQTPRGVIKVVLPESFRINDKELKREEAVRLFSSRAETTPEVEFTVDDNGNLKSLYFIRSIPQ